MPLVAIIILRFKYPERLIPFQLSPFLQIFLVSDWFLKDRVASPCVLTVAPT